MRRTIHFSWLHLFTWAAVAILSVAVGAQEGPVYEVQWRYTRDIGFSDSVHSLRKTSDGGYLVAGTAWLHNSPRREPFLMKIHPEGILQWETTYGGVGGNISSVAAGATQEPDGSYSIIALGKSTPTSPTEVFFFGAETSGTLSWEQRYPVEEMETVYDSVRTTDGAFVVVGDKDRVGYMAKISASKGIEWERGHQGARRYFRPRAISQTSDGGFILAGMGGGHSEVFLEKTDTSGTFEWEIAPMGLFGRSAGVLAIRETSDGGFVLCDWKFGVWKTDSSGVLEWENSRLFTGRSHFASCVEETSDGGFVVVGRGIAGFEVFGKIEITKLDALGEVEWNAPIGSDSDIGAAVLEVKNGYIVAGMAYGAEPQQSDAFILFVGPREPPSAPVGAATLSYTVTEPSVGDRGSTVTYTYRWTSDGGDEVIHGPTPLLQDVLIEWELVDTGETWTVSVTPSDGILAGPPVVGRVKILDKATRQAIWLVY